MKRLGFSVASAAFVAVAVLLGGCEAPDGTGGAAADTTTAPSDADGYEVLFDGSSLDAWQGFQTDSIPSKWVIDEGALYFNPDAPGSGGDLVTAEEYGDFELAFEWRISDCGNSGVIYRADDAEQYDAPWETGPEFQILDNACHPDAAEGGDRHAAANYDMNAPTQDVVRPAGEWNESRIVADSAHVEHWLNDTKVVEYELWSDAWNQNVAGSKWTEYPDYGKRSQGRIALQDHGNPAWFRNIRIRRL